jgi:predicted Fe-Mo cluster-binding NifX family protein
MTIKIAIPTNDGKTISRHFGQSKAFLVVSFEDGEITGQELRELPDAGDDDHHHHDHDHNHEHGHGQGQGRGRGMGGNPAHASKFDHISDCQYLIGGGMGQAAVQRLNGMGIQVALTDHKNIDDLLAEIKTGQVKHNPKRAH